ncbi:MAG TPA: alanine racemase [Thermaerobacter sp.]
MHVAANWQGGHDRDHPLAGPRPSDLPPGRPAPNGPWRGLGHGELPPGLQAALARARLEVDLDTLAANVAEVRRLLAPGTRLMAVVKGDAYGFGAEIVARTFLASGAGWLGTATADAAIRLREAGIRAPILVFDAPAPELVPLWLRYGLTATVTGWDGLEAISRAAAATGWSPPEPAEGPAAACPVHVEVDLGFGRGGLPPGEVAPFLRRAGQLPGVRVEGLFAQLPAATRPGAARHQLNRFRRLVDELEEAGLRPPIVHCAESTLLVVEPAAQFDMVRIGNLLYGFACRAARRAGVAVRNPGRLVARVMAVHPAGDGGSGYRGGWSRPGGEIAVLSVGLADGLRPARDPRTWLDRAIHTGRRLAATLGFRTRGLQPRIRVRGRDVLLRGEFMMNHCLFDATGLGLHAGDEVELVAGRLTAGAHLPIVYLQGGRPVAVAWPGRQLASLADAGTAGALAGTPAGEAAGDTGDRPASDRATGSQPGNARQDHGQGADGAGADHAAGNTAAAASPAAEEPAARDPAADPPAAGTAEGPVPAAETAEAPYLRNPRQCHQ